MFKRKGGGVKGLLNNVKKNALFLKDGFPYSGYIHDVKHGLAIKFLFDKDQNVGY